MLKKTIFSLFFLVCSLGTFSTVQAEESIFGPETFKREKKKPKKEIREFQVTNPSGLYKLTIINGKPEDNDDSDHDDEDKKGKKEKKHKGKKSDDEKHKKDKHHKKHRVTSAKIWLNGNLIAKPPDFKKHVQVITKNIQLQNNNVLEVKLKGKPKSQITISICCEDSQQPSNNPPTANAGPDQTVNTVATVTLDGSGSTDPDGDPLTFQWSIFSAPVGSAAVLSNPASVTPAITPDLARRLHHSINRQ